MFHATTIDVAASEQERGSDLMGQFDIEVQRRAVEKSTKPVVSIKTLHPMDIPMETGNKMAILRVVGSDNREIDMRPIAARFGTGSRGPRIIMSNTTYVIAPVHMMYGLVYEALAAEGYRVLLNGNPFPANQLLH